MASTVRRDVLAQGLNRPMGPIVTAHLARPAKRSGVPPGWVRDLQSLNVASFLRDYRRFSLLAGTGRRPGSPGVLTLPQQSADQLIALFLKLNISDPNNSEATAKALQRIAEELRREAVEAAEEKADAAAQALEDAEAQQDPVAAIVKALLSFLGL